MNTTEHYAYCASRLRGEGACDCEVAANKAHTGFILEDADGRRAVPHGTAITIPKRGQTFAQAAQERLDAQLPPLLAQRALERRTLVIAERIAQADSYLHDVNLPSYGELVVELRHVVEAYGAGDSTRRFLERLSEVQA